jgi:type III secretory pathway component EscU
MSLKKQTWFKYFVTIALSVFFTIIFITIFVLFGLDSQIWNQYGLVGSFRYLFIDAFDSGYIYIFAIVPLSLILIVITIYLIINILPYYSKTITELKKELEKEKSNLENEYKNKMSYLEDKELRRKNYLKDIERKANKLENRLGSFRGRAKEVIIILNNDPPNIGQAKSLLKSEIKKKRQ